MGGYLPGSMHPDWPIIFEAAFQSLPNLDDYLRTWKHHPDSCRFCKGICYSGVQANYLCELDGDKNSMLDDAASVTREGKPRDDDSESSSSADSVDSSNSD